jgi:uncharacterized membrane protein
MNSNIVLLLALAIGFVAGLRALTAPAAVSWAAHLRWLKLSSTSLRFLGSPITVGIFTLLAIVELITDQLPSTPSRTAPPGLIARFVTGGLSGAAIALAASQSVIAGSLLGAFGGIIGAFVGYQARTGLVKALNTPDFIIATLEDAVAIGAALFIVTRF